MSTNDRDHITQFLQSEDLDAAENQEKLYNLVYDQLKSLAGRLLAGDRANHTFSATDLVNEGFFKLHNLDEIQWASRSHFYKVSTRAMKQILIDYARQRNRLKRGAGAGNIPLDQAEHIASTERAIEEFVSLHEALQAYDRFDPQGRGKRIIEYMYFQGLQVQEIADLLGVTTKTIQRDRKFAEAWLKRYLAGE